MGWTRGFEPPTTGITIRYSNQLSYAHHNEPELSHTALRMARPAGLEPTTAGLEGRCSIRLSYGRNADQSIALPSSLKLVGVEGFELSTSSSQSWRSTRLSYTPIVLAFSPNRCHLTK